MDIAEIKRQNDELYKRIQQEYLHDKSHDEKYIREHVLEEVNPLLKSLSETEAESTSDYTWLSDAASKWQTLLLNLNVPRSIRIPLPPKPLEVPPPPRNIMTEDDIRKDMDVRAYYISLDRKARREELFRQILDTPVRQVLLELVLNWSKIAEDSEVRWDREVAETQFAADVLDGRVNFVERIGRDSYRWLETQWLGDVKRYKAYLRWERGGDGYEEEERQNLCSGLR